jgi:hypothetical protein
MDIAEKERELKIIQIPKIVSVAAKDIHSGLGKGHKLDFNQLTILNAKIRLPITVVPVPSIRID